MIAQARARPAQALDLSRSNFIKNHSKIDNLSSYQITHENEPKRVISSMHLIYSLEPEYSGALQALR